ncbi:MAG TPA: hypothetical protein VFJ06_08580 [Halococcus sp.]|nr:hypothetical protein [Halococcus sp.]
MRLDAAGRLLTINAPEAVGCTACDGYAERLSSAWQGEGIAYHNYQCSAKGCPAGGTIIERENGEKRRVGPVFGDRDLAVRLATREHPDQPAEAEEVRA